MVYVMRYGNQQLSEIESWSPAKLRWVADTLARILEAENAAPGE